MLTNTCEKERAFSSPERNSSGAGDWVKKAYSPPFFARQGRLAYWAAAGRLAYWAAAGRLAYWAAAQWDRPPCLSKGELS